MLDWKAVLKNSNDVQRMTEWMNERNMFTHSAEITNQQTVDHLDPDAILSRPRHLTWYTHIVSDDIGETKGGWCTV